MTELPHPATGRSFTSPVPAGTGWPGDPATPETPVARTAAQVRRLAARAGLEELAAEISVCRACPRLVRWREEVAVAKRASYAAEPYWGRPIPGWGAPRPAVLVVGLAPAAHGANRTGRVFTGDRSGDWLFAALHRVGLANRGTSVDAADGLELVDTRLVATVRCAPPQNKPSTTERDSCAPWIEAELALLVEHVRVVVALGSIGWDATLRSFRALGWRLPARSPGSGTAPRPRWRDPTGTSGCSGATTRASRTPSRAGSRLRCSTRCWLGPPLYADPSPRIPTGRGGRLKSDWLWVRVPPGAPDRFACAASPLGVIVQPSSPLGWTHRRQRERLVMTRGNVSPCLGAANAPRGESREETRGGICMHVKKLLNGRFTMVVAGAAVIALVGAGTGYSAGLITSRDIKDKTIKFKDLRSGTVKKLKGQTGPEGPQGPQGPAGPSGTATYAGPNWSIVDRNVEENGDSYLRSGPGTPPMGVGSLGLRTGGGGVDKAAFGNESDFLNTALSTFNTLKYSIYVSGEDLGNYAENAPNLSIEIDPTGAADNTAPNFSSLVFNPSAADLTANDWKTVDASTEQRWWLTGLVGTASGCTQATYCTLAQVKAFYTNASVYTVQITKGRDYEFSGAVDALVINNKTYDFEPFGVTESTN